MPQPILQKKSRINFKILIAKFKLVSIFAALKKSKREEVKTLC